MIYRVNIILINIYSLNFIHCQTTLPHMLNIKFFKCFLFLSVYTPCLQENTVVLSRQSVYSLHEKLIVVVKIPLGSSISSHF